jgi:hypothetical protein
VTQRAFLIGMVGMCAATLSGQTQTPSFRSDADAVTVNVSVKKSNVPVGGLTATDFRLFDNDVLQDVATVSVEAVPIDVSFVVDTSGIVSADVDTMREAVRGMTEFLRPSDRFRVLTTGNAVVNAIPWRSAGVPDTSTIQPVPGEIALVMDSVFMALFHRTAPDRRHLVVALIFDDDWCSLVSGPSLARAAARSGAVFHLIGMPRTPWQDGLKLFGPPLGAHALCRTTFNGGVDARPFLSEATSVTGGTVRSAEFRAERAAVKAFDAIFDDFRRSYLLHYMPRGVERTGWHRLRVEMPARGYTVRARPGYWASADAPATPVR